MIIFHDTAKQVMPNHSWTQSRMLERATAYAVSHPCIVLRVEKSQENGGRGLMCNVKASQKRIQGKIRCSSHASR